MFSKLRFFPPTLCQTPCCIKCSRPISSLPGLQGIAKKKLRMQFKNFNTYKTLIDQLFINKVVKIFTLQFDESIIKFYLVKVFQILMKFL